MSDSIVINIIEKIYKDVNNKDLIHRAIKGLKLQIPKGEFCSIIGPSGCGKSTLLNIVSGLDDEFQGSLKYGDQSSTKKKKIAYMFQTPRLLPWLNVIENVEIVLSQSQKIAGRARLLLKLMGLQDFLNYYPNKLSGGMQRRVALARSFASSPELFILDEPFVSLDAPAANLLRDMLIELWMKEPTTILFVTHDIEECIYLSDRIIFLSKAPAKVIKEKEINIERPRFNKIKEINNIKNELLKNNKKLLEGED